MADRELLQALGQRLRLLRSERGVTAAGLSRASGVGKATLSQLEAGQGNPTVETLGALAAALQLPLGDLLADLAPAPVRLLRAVPDTADTPSQQLLLRQTGGAATEMWRLRLDTGQRLDRQGHAAGTIEHITVIRGQLSTGPAENTHDLGIGDFISYRADGPHTYAATEPLEALVIMTYPLSVPPLQ